MKTLTIAQAWREIARRIAEGRWDGDGLCCEVGNLCYTQKITYEQKHNMWNWIEYHLFGELYFDDCGAADARVLAALFLALEAEDMGL